MPDTTEPTTTPTQLVEELYQDYLRTTASPLPRHPAALGWQMNTGVALAGFVTALYYLQKTDPGMAQEIVDWWKRAGDENFGPEEGPDTAEFEFWALGTIAQNPERLEQWAAEAREAAEKVAAVSAQPTPPSAARPPHELPPETTQASSDWEDCDACVEVGEMCRYHNGIIAGHHTIREAAAATPNMTVTELLAQLDAGE